MIKARIILNLRPLCLTQRWGCLLHWRLYLEVKLYLPRTMLSSFCQYWPFWFFLIFPWVISTFFWLKYPSFVPAAAAAAKLLQSCQTLCNPIDGSPLGSPVPGILQERILEWVALFFSIICTYKHLNHKFCTQEPFSPSKLNICTLQFWILILEFNL